MEKPHREVTRTTGDQEGGQEVNGQRSQNNLADEQAAGQRRVEGGGHPGGGGAGHHQPQARCGKVKEAAQGGSHHGGGLHQRAFTAYGGPGTDGKDGGKRAQKAGFGRHVAIAQGHGFHVFRGFGRYKALREQEGQAGQQATRRRNENTPGPVLGSHFLESLYLPVTVAARQQVLHQFHTHFEKKGGQGAQGADKGRPDEDDLLVSQLDFLPQVQRHTEPGPRHMRLACGLVFLVRHCRAC